MEAGTEGGNAVPCSDDEPGSASRAMRVKEAIRQVGTARDAARLSGVPYGTLQNYAQGGELKLSNAAALARATGVRLEWLATGEGPMRPSQELPAPAPPARSEPAERPALSGLSEERAATAPSDLGLTWQVNPDRLARAYELALKGIAILPGHKPDPRRLMQVTLLLYDEMTEAEAAKRAASDAPKPPP